MKTINLIHNIYDDRVEMNFRELGMKDRIKFAIRILLGLLIVLRGNIKINNK